MLRLEIVRLFWAEWNVIEIYHFTGTSLGQVRWGRKHWEKKDCLQLGHKKTCCVWDKAGFHTPGHWSLARWVLTVGISHPSVDPNICSSVCFDGHSCLWRGIVPTYICLVGLLFLVLCGISEKAKRSTRYGSLELPQKKSLLSLICSG